MKFYVTTPIYYVNDQPHIGHAYTSLAADVLARYYRMRGMHVMFLTGTDEHGQKVADAAASRSLSPKEHADSMMENFHDLTLKLNLTNDAFIRTTDDAHKQVVQKLMQQLWDKGEIVRRTYSGWYCTPCERFWTEKDLHEGNCPECSRPVEQIEEDNYFFLMSRYASRLEQHIVDNPEFILPETRRNEVLGFLRSQPLMDLCISRPKKRLDWGVPLPFDEDYVTYVWFDALINYYSGSQYLAPEIFRLAACDMDEGADAVLTGEGGLSPQDDGGRDDGGTTDKTDDSDVKGSLAPSGVGGESHQLEGGPAPWPADVHLIGKDILTTHAVYWITMLMALGLPLPKMIFAHGWWTIEGQKMSKSLGNVVDPAYVVDKYGNDAFRFFLFREVPFGLDGDYSEASLVARINSDLANDFGNLASRTLKMAQSYFSGEVPKPGAELTDDEHELKAIAEGLPHRVEGVMRVLKFQRALEEIWRLLARANKYLDEQAPWKLAKDEASAERLGTVMYNTLEALRVLALHLHPIMPDATQKLWQALGLEGDLDTLDLFTNAAWGVLKPGTKLHKLENLFPRIDTKKIDTKKKKDNKGRQEKKKVQENNTEQQKDDGLINIKDFAKVELKTGKVLAAERVEGSLKLIRMQVDTGQPEQLRQIVAGIGKAYAPDDLVGKTVVVVVNLKPAKLM
ncbi:hypothetical protein LCGC14_2077600, partial [marine sediment metagenome]